MQSGPDPSDENEMIKSVKDILETNGILTFEDGADFIVAYGASHKENGGDLENENVKKTRLSREQFLDQAYLFNTWFHSGYRKPK